MNQIMTYGGADLSQPVQNTTTEMMVSRQAQEVQAAMVVAKRFPRDETAAITRIMQACTRKGLAESAVYEYPRGGERVTGPSIRLAETVARYWGNLDYGITELDQHPGESTVMAYCWDLETNTREAKIFTVPHIRQTRSGAKALTDPRDIYELVANQGARRLRSCILGIIPGDVVDAALDQCQKTLTSGKEPIIDRVRKMLVVFQQEFGVNQKQIETLIGCKADAFTEQAVIRLLGIYNNLKDGSADRSQYFDMTIDEAMPETAETPTDPKKAPAKSAGQQKAVSIDDL